MLDKRKHYHDIKRIFIFYFFDESDDSESVE